MSTAINNAKEIACAPEKRRSIRLTEQRTPSHPNQRGLQAELFSQRACDGGRPGGRQTGSVREGDVEAVDTSAPTNGNSSMTNVIVPCDMRHSAFVYAAVLEATR
jgi:hypothetical protein